MRCIEQAGRRRGRARETGPPGHVCKPAGGVATARRCAASPSPPLLASRLTDVTQTPLGYFLTLSHVQQQELALPGADHLLVRSEEHTSELQSLMRISYAVFFLKKKKK